MIGPLIALVLINTVIAKDEVGAKQLLRYVNEHKEPSGYLSNSYGYPVTSIEANLGINRDSSLLVNHYIYESMSSFSLERRPPRLRNANGCGAKGYFEVTHDVSEILNVKVFNTVGKKTPILARFSSSYGQIGSPEVPQRSKGFAMKFYTEEGNLDLIGIHIDVLAIKNPDTIVSYARAGQTSPITGSQDPLVAWKFVADNPEAMSDVVRAFSPQGQPNSYRHLSGYTLHTYQVENYKGDVSFIKLNWFPDDGIHNFTNAELVGLQGASPDYLTEELYDSISNESYPSWTLCMQVVLKKDMKNVSLTESELFDVTMNWPEETFPNIPIGKLTLNNHVNNHFAEVEQVAFNPGNLVPGIRGVDKLFEARVFLYRDSQIYRLGTGFNIIEVNQPINKPLTYNRDGTPPVGDNGGDAPNYYPNSFHGVVPVNRSMSSLYRPHINPEPTNYGQIAKFYKDLSDADRQSTVNNLGQSLSTMPMNIRDTILNIMKKIDKDLHKSVKSVINNANKVNKN